MSRVSYGSSINCNGRRVIGRQLRSKDRFRACDSFYMRQQCKDCIVGIVDCFGQDANSLWNVSIVYLLDYGLAVSSM